MMPVASPDKKLTLFALRLALLDKAANGLGTLAFIWATVVILGGFAETLERIDFWFVSIILLIEGTRIFRLSSKLKWQRKTTLASLRDDVIEAVDLHNLLKKTWYRLIYKNVSRLLSCVQLLSALASVCLSLYRLARQEYGVIFSGSDIKNRTTALNIFYGLSLADALLYLFEKAYWNWKIRGRNLLEEVSTRYGLDRNDDVVTVGRFFYDTYLRCIKASILDDSKMEVKELVSYSVLQLQSSDDKEKLLGVRVLSKLAKGQVFAEETLRAIGTTQDVAEKLIEMIKCRDYQQRELRKAAAEIIFNLVKINHTKSIPLAGIAGYVEPVESLLFVGNIESHLRQDVDPLMCPSDSWDFSLRALEILEILANDQESCGKIGSSRSLLRKIIALAELRQNAPVTEINIPKKALRLLQILANTEGSTKDALTKEMLETDSAIKNLGDVLEISNHGLQIMAIDTLKCFTLEEAGRERLGNFSGVLANLVSVFLMDINRSEDNQTIELVAKAGEVLALLTLENEANCETINQLLQARLYLVVSLTTVLDKTGRGLYATRILWNLFQGRFLKGNLTEMAVQIVKLIVMEKQDEHQEAAIGLAVQIFRPLTKSEFDDVFKESGSLIRESSGSTKRSLISKILDVFRKHPHPSSDAPSIRRLSIELLICLLEKYNAAMEKRKEFLEALDRVTKTTSEMENYTAFSGSLQLCSHHNRIQRLVNFARDWLRDEKEVHSWRKVIMWHSDSTISWAKTMHDIIDRESMTELNEFVGKVDERFARDSWM